MDNSEPHHEMPSSTEPHNKMPRLTFCGVPQSAVLENSWNSAKNGLSISMQRQAERNAISRDYITEALLLFNYERSELV